MNNMIWYLLVIFQFKHFFADYILQNSYMLGKFKPKGWVLPLSAHCGIHWLFTFWIVGFSLPGTIDYNTGTILLFGLPTLDFIIHFIMDRIKASPKLLGRYEALSKSEYKSLYDAKLLCESGVDKLEKPEVQIELKRQLNSIQTRFESNVKFWWSLGVDQAVHHLTDILIIYLIMRNL